MPAASSCLYRALDSTAVPKPAYWRMVHGRPVYIVGYTPRVYGIAARLAQRRRGVPALEVGGPVHGRERES